MKNAQTQTDADSSTLKKVVKKCAETQTDQRLTFEGLFPNSTSIKGI